MMWLVLLVSSVFAQDVTVCCDEKGCEDDVRIESCERSGGSWATCDDEVCETLVGREVVQSKMVLSYEIGAWGAYFQANHREPDGYVPPNPHDFDLVDPCMNWAEIYNQDPQVCEGGIPENPQNPDGSGSHVDVCDDPSEIPCAICSLSFVLCESYALPSGNGALIEECYDSWRSCIKNQCGIDCDY